MGKNDILINVKVVGKPQFSPQLIRLFLEQLSKRSRVIQMHKHWSIDSLEQVIKDSFFIDWVKDYNDDHAPLGLGLVELYIDQYFKDLEEIYSSLGKTVPNWCKTALLTAKVLRSDHFLIWGDEYNKQNCTQKCRYELIGDYFDSGAYKNSDNFLLL